MTKYTTGHQTSLFSVADVAGGYRVPSKEPLQIGVDALQAWKQRIFQHQQQVTVNAPSQGSLFTLPPTDAELAESIDLFKLPRQNTEFWRWQADDDGVSALYFVVDDELPIVLYVGETIKSGMRWKGEHDCKRYILNYISAHRPHSLPVAVNISFWSNAPTNTRGRQRLESALIKKWKSPFNKENWKYWNTPFVGEP
ncbi:GIY-YIG nuclease family protein [Phormidium sp. CLA17]|uniref:GIY-YIG nuclease family protein n=1 Tax=Leptolyngbya sp. Cla-17 TaxID=2803751 RepID=UPI001491DBED|nr:GIY-YIG nuclease family protein [Leptolyngbya sp. Cla-17]MBM0742048.1 GIY-YIG nuclease family protein [Leptolyngbya sp. Cla-17]